MLTVLLYVVVFIVFCAYSAGVAFAAFRLGKVTAYREAVESDFMVWDPHNGFQWKVWVERGDAFYDETHGTYRQMPTNIELN
jgi:hypothetical protein